MLHFDYEATERWMAIIGKRVEKGSSRKGIREEGQKLPHQVLQDLLFCDYLDWLKFLIVQMEKPQEKTGTYREFYNSECMTKEQTLKRKRNSFWQHNRKRRKLIDASLSKNTSPQKEAVKSNNVPPLEEEFSDVDDEADFMEWPEHKNFLEDGVEL